jgi:hypothetical protein
VPFIMSHQARTFFERIGVKSRPARGKSKTGEFGILLDAYWLCAFLGLRRSQCKAPDGDSAELVKYFAGESQGQMNAIRGLGFYYHCRDRGLNEEDKRHVLAEMSNFLSDQPRELGEAGYRLFNRHAQGGFDLIFETLESDCEEMSDFLSAYLSLLEG